MRSVFGLSDPFPASLGVAVVVKSQPLILQRGQNTKIEGIDTATTKISSGSPMRQ